LSITGFQGDCFGDSKGKIIAVGLGGVKPYVWTPNPTNLSTIKVDTVTAEKFELLNLPSKMYTIKLTDKNGCTAQIDQFISPKENIQINIDTSVKFNIAEKTKLILTINPSGKYKYLWSPEKIFGTQINDSTPIIKLYDRAYIGLTVTNENFCSKSVKFEIPVKIPPIYFWLPTAFTPDDNSLNDGYAPIGNFDWADFQIYNRWGQKIFHSSKDVQSWDGTFMGEPCQEGTYIVVARLKYDRFEQKRDARTSFTLLR
jgi:gliding motility-associated-like protein